MDSLAIITPQTEEELRALVRRYEDAHYIANASENKTEVAGANAFLAACEKAFDECLLGMDENDTVFIKKPVEKVVAEKTAWPEKPIEDYETIASGNWGYLIFYTDMTHEFSAKQRPSDEEILNRWGSYLKR